jgi:uncharacterized membrane protein
MTILRWLAILLILRVLASILTNYPDYFPPNFDSLFLQGREATFTGAYRAAFYVHIFSGPVVLFNGLILLNETVRRRHGAWHRCLGRVQVFVLLLLVLPSSVIMSRHAFGGWPAGLSFLLLSFATALCAIVGVVHARGRRFDRHRRWMLRSYILICSAVFLRLISGAAGLIGVPSPEQAYVFAAWSSWLVPLAAYEIVEAFRVHHPVPSRSAGPRCVEHPRSYRIKAMSEEQFTQLLRHFIHRQPFVPFVIELVNGDRIHVDSPAVAFSGPAAGFLDEGEGLIRFSCEEVRAITPASAEVKP